MILILILILMLILIPTLCIGSWVGDVRPHTLHRARVRLRVPAAGMRSIRAAAHLAPPGGLRTGPSIRSYIEDGARGDSAQLFYPYGLAMLSLRNTFGCGGRSKHKRSLVRINEQ
jgi:hypothetical protein